jgi:hypothetical protein
MERELHEFDAVKSLKYQKSPLLERKSFREGGFL